MIERSPELSRPSAGADEQEAEAMKDDPDPEAA